MKKLICSISVIVSFVVLFSSCKDKPVSGGGIKYSNNSNGKAAEVVLVIDTPYWSLPARELIDSILQKDQPAINQVEQMFDLLHFKNADFNAFYRKHRNIVHFDYNPQYSSNVFRINNDMWASPQVYVQIKGNNQDSCLALFLEHQDEIVDALYLNDLKRLQLFYTDNHNAEAEKLIRDRFGINVTVPYQYKLLRVEEDFVWIGHRTARNDRFVMIYKSAMNGLTRENIIAVRNTITKKYIPGAVQGAYPILSNVYGYPSAKACAVNGKVGLELRGLWESINDEMGGPFVSFSFLDNSKEYCISVDGFVYAPEEEKRDYIREVESIVKTVK